MAGQGAEVVQVLWTEGANVDKPPECGKASQKWKNHWK
jgi:hypothetical protein